MDIGEKVILVNEASVKYAYLSKRRIEMNNSHLPIDPQIELGFIIRQKNAVEGIEALKVARSVAPLCLPVTVVSLLRACIEEFHSGPIDVYEGQAYEDRVAKSDAFIEAAALELGITSYSKVLPFGTAFFETN
jgi:hypothetical protein